MNDLYKELDYAVQSDLYASGKFIKMYNDLEQENKQLKEEISYLKSDEGIVEMLHNLQINKETKLIEYKEIKNE